MSHPNATVRRSRWFAILGAGCAPLIACSASHLANGASTSTSTSDDAGVATSSAQLASLTTSPLALSPGFSPSIYDYTVPCAEGANALTLTATAAPGAQVAVTQPTTAAAAAAQSVNVSMTPNQATVFQLTSGGQSAEYWVRCLPPDFPVLTFTPHPAAGTPTPGWYLLGVGDYAAIYDGNGVPVWYRDDSAMVWNVDLRAPNVVSYIAETPIGGLSTPNGTFEVRPLADPGDAGSVSAVNAPTNLHELQTLSDGNYIVFAEPLVTGVDLTGLVVDDAGAPTNATVADCVLQELDPSGALVWSWDALQHIDPAKECTFPATDLTDDTTVYDVFHCNAVAEATSAMAGASPGDLLVSSRHMDAIFLVSKATGAIKWKLGGAPYNKDGAQILTLPAGGAFYRQHDARFLPSGQISLFDDETDQSNPARGISFALDLDAGAAAVTWQYAAAVSSAAMGSVRGDTEGDTVIGWGELNGTVFTELNAQNQDVLDAYSATVVSYRAVKVPPSSLDLETMRRAVGQ